MEAFDREKSQQIGMEACDGKKVKRNRYVRNKNQVKLKCSIKSKSSGSSVKRIEALKTKIYGTYTNIQRMFESEQQKKVP